VLTLAVVTGYLYDIIGPATVFVIVGSLDLVISVITTYLSCAGKISSRKAESKDGKLELAKSCTKEAIN